jgi:cell division septation protein DedD
MIVTTLTKVVILLCAILFLRVSHADQIQGTSNVIVADPLYVRLIGNFDPRMDDVYFISALQITFDDYYQTYYTDTLHGFDIAAIFIYEATLYEFQPQSTNDESTTKITSWCEIQTTFSIPIDLDSSTFNTDIATQFVEDFFSMEKSTELLGRLSKSSNITLHTIESFTASSETVRKELEAFVYLEADTSSSKSKVLKVLASISGTIICLAVIALMLSTLMRGYKERKNDDRLGIKKREKDTRTITIPNTNAKTSSKLDQTISDIEEDPYVDLAQSLNEQQHENAVETSKKNDPPIVPSELFAIDTDDDDDDNETVATRNHVSPTTSQYNSPTSSNTSSNASPVWSMFSGTSTDPTISPYSTEEVLRKRYRWHDSDADDDVDISQLLSLPEEPQSPSVSLYESSKSGTMDGSDSTGSSTTHDS